MSLKIGDKVFHKHIISLNAVIIRKHAQGWEVKIEDGGFEIWLDINISKRYIPVAHPNCGGPRRSAGPYQIQPTAIFKITEENNMKFVRVQKQYLVDGMDLYTMNEQQLLDHIELYQARIDKIDDIEFDSTRMEEERILLTKLIKKLIRLLDSKK